MYIVVTAVRVTTMSSPLSFDRENFETRHMPFAQFKLTSRIISSASLDDNFVQLDNWKVQ